MQREEIRGEVASPAVRLAMAVVALVLVGGGLIVILKPWKPTGWEKRTATLRILEKGTAARVPEVDVTFTYRGETLFEGTTDEGGDLPFELRWDVYRYGTNVPSVRLEKDGFRTWQGEFGDDWAFHGLEPLE